MRKLSNNLRPCLACHHNNNIIIIMPFFRNFNNRIFFFLANISPLLNFRGFISKQKIHHDIMHRSTEALVQLLSLACFAGGKGSKPRL